MSYILRRAPSAFAISTRARRPTGVLPSGSCLHAVSSAAAALRQAMQLDPNAAHPAGRRARVIAAKTMQRLKKGTP